MASSLLSSVRVRAGRLTIVQHRRRLFSDYVIVGAGSAGCVLANRLSESGKNRVTLLEAGSSDRSHPTDLLLHMPTALALPMGYKRYNWGFLPEPEPNLNNRVIACHRGRGLGGSSSINGLVYVRGNAQDFEAWEELGAKGWSYKDVLPYFRKAETWQNCDKDDDLFRGNSGPLHVCNGANYLDTPLHKAFIEAGVDAGYGYTPDYNAHRQEGFGPMAMTVFHSGPNRGMRCSTASAYLHPAMSRPNLELVTDAEATRILFDKDDNGRSRAVGVEYRKGGQLEVIHANKEVILCAGSIQSPQLLQVSGVGDASLLEQIGVPVVHDLKGVGQNLMDHLEVFFQQECKEPVTLAPHVSSWWRRLLIGIRWILKRDGHGASNHFESCAFLRSRAGVSYPDVQFHFLPVAVSYDGSSIAESSTGHAFQLHVGTCRSRSRGHVHARTSNMIDPPEIKFNYMSHKDDFVDFRNAIAAGRQVMNQPALKDLAGKEISPGPNVQSDEEIDEWVRNHAETAYHPCGTCAIGSVVDSSGSVIGVDGVRVVDASVFPRITNGNLNAVVIMVAERMADIIQGKLLDPVEFDPEHHPWRPTVDTDKTDRETPARV